MDINPLEIPDVKLLVPKKIGDPRGFFMETFRQSTFNEAVGENIVFVQDNHSFSKPAYTIRGLHFQSPPRPQAKLVRCTRGKIIDVAVDVRTNSPTYGQHIKAILDAQNCHQLFIPVGFLHGFATLEPNCEVQYKCTDYYVPKYDGAVMWNDLDLAINWGFEAAKAVLSNKDAIAPAFKGFNSPFI